jgi:hypothetical protein
MKDECHDKNRYFARGSAQVLSGGWRTAAGALNRRSKEKLSEQIFDLIKELEGGHDSGLEAVDWSRRHIENKPRTILDI